MKVSMLNWSVYYSEQIKDSHKNESNNDLEKYWISNYFDLCYHVFWGIGPNFCIFKSNAHNSLFNFGLLGLLLRKN